MVSGCIHGGVDGWLDGWVAESVHRCTDEGVVKNK